MDGEMTTSTQTTETAATYIGRNIYGSAGTGRRCGNRKPGESICL